MKAGDTKMMLLGLALAAAGTGASTGGHSGLERAVADAVDCAARQYNVSFVSAVFYDANAADGSRGLQMATHAAGVDDRATGKPITTRGRIPSGSVTKTFTAALAMQLAEQGKLDLDAPVHLTVDPWLAAQSPPGKPLRALWGGDSESPLADTTVTPTIERVTARHLLSMRSGLGEYDDGKMQAWTVAHPDEDYPPYQYLVDLNKTFLFPPGEGGSYSSDGFVLLGLTMAAATSVPSWDRLNQRAVLENAGLELNDTVFMDHGRCSSYPGVVHQYSLAGSFAATAAATTAKCTRSSWQNGTVAIGEPLPVQLDGKSAAECCQIANTAPLSYYTSAWNRFSNGSCQLIYEITAPDAHVEGAVLGGVVSPPLTPSMFTDLFGDSCTNGWVMGNIATSPQDTARFFHALFAGQVVKPASLKAMQDWNPMTNGFEACRTTDTEGCLLYGLGLMELPMLYPAAGPCPVSDPACVCAPAVDNAAPVCEVRIAMLGHLGEDWGSSMQLAGMLPRFNVSVALGSNGASGMNYSLPVRENVGANDVAICMMLSAIATELEPTFPKFSCTTEGANRAGAGTASLRPGRAGRPALHTLDTRWQARDPLL